MLSLYKTIVVVFLNKSIQEEIMKIANTRQYGGPVHA